MTTANYLEPPLTRLSACVGASFVLTDAQDTSSYTEDWRKKYFGRALAVVLAKCTVKPAR